MPIAVDTFEVATAVATRPVTTSNQYAFTPALAAAVADLPTDGRSAVLVPLPGDLPRKHGFVRAVRIYVDRNVTGTFEVRLTVAGDKVQILRTGDRDQP